MKSCIVSIVLVYVLANASAALAQTKPTTRFTAESRTNHLNRYTEEGFENITFALGVRGTYAEGPGYTIKKVFPGTAADVSGLNINDTILEVDGIPVGYYGSRVYHIWKRYAFSDGGKVQLTVVYEDPNTNEYKYFYPTIQLDRVGTPSFAPLATSDDS